MDHLFELEQALPPTPVTATVGKPDLCTFCGVKVYLWSNGITTWWIHETRPDHEHQITPSRSR